MADAAKSNQRRGNTVPLETRKVLMRRANQEFRRLTSEEYDKINAQAKDWQRQTQQDIDNLIEDARSKALLALGESLELRERQAGVDEAYTRMRRRHAVECQQQVIAHQLKTLELLKIHTHPPNLL